MNLNAQLSAISQGFADKADPKVLEIMQAARKQLEDSELHKQALGRGEKITNFVLRDARNKDFTSQDALKKGPLLISWYRGIW